MDKFFLSTNTSAYNIYSKCYKSNSVDELSYINTGCEDDAGIIEYLNDPHVRENWNILPNQQPWVPCNRTIFTEYMNGKNSYELYPSLIKNKLRIVIISLFSGFTQVTLTQPFLSSAQRDGLKI